MIAALTLPWPPSRNHMYESQGFGGRMRLSAVTSQYRCVVAKRVRDARKLGTVPAQALEGRLKVTIYASAPGLNLRDMDNVSKAPLDALTKAKVWGDDGQIDVQSVVRAQSVKGGRILVVIEELPPGTGLITLDALYHLGY